MKRRGICTLRYLFISSVAIALFVLLITGRNLSQNYKQLPLPGKLNNVIEFVFPRHQNESLRSCIAPNLRPFEGDFYRKYFKDLKPIKCAEEADWVETSNGSVFISNRFTKEQQQNITCNLQYILRKDDRHVTYSTAEEIPANSKMALKNDWFKVDCRYMQKRYQNVHSSVAFKPEVHARSSEKDISKGLGMNVLVIHFDSMSRMTYKRKFTKTYEFIEKNLKGYILNNFNAIGDGTGENLTPFLTGATEKELPVTLKGHPHGQHVDVWPFFWYKFRKYGYATAYFEDCSLQGTYQLRLRGFKKQPTDHYMRPFYIAAEPTYKNNTYLCLGSKRRSQVYFDNIKEFNDMYKNQRKFLFSIHGELSHDDLNLAQTADEDFVELLTYLKDKGHLNNTMLILGSDHGMRFGSSRSHPQGKLEQMLPFFSISLPPWFQTKYPELANNLKINTNTLTTVFDAHETIKNMFNFTGGGIGNTSSRGISLFKKVPFNRTCKHASITEELCACKKWIAKRIDDEKVQEAVRFFVKYLNNLTISYRESCEEFKLQRVTSAFLRTVQIGIDIYEIQLIMSPGDAAFELAVKRNDAMKTMTIEGTIKRINKYNETSQCIISRNPKLRKYCYCKKQ